ncbi:uncharacterized protein LOC129939929 [Eupeodes corollae]|uniref:uncharacterized protein LOC129939929 n=1 Tax=Eupeodes corollae TaxID=290404 RepID=UPI002490F02D|nr:uncharacterized protein LOC129939929 [Eupeodes corollae]
MSKFLGVISTRCQHPSDDRVIEFTDLELLADFLFHETQNLFYEFHRKSEFISEQEIRLFQNLNMIMEILNFERKTHFQTLELEHELEKIGFCLDAMERSIDCLDRLPENFVACKCISNPERRVALEKLVKLSEDCTRIEEQMYHVQKEENLSFDTNSCDQSSNLVLFLDLHQQILQNLEQKSDKIIDQLQKLDALFINAYKRSIGACYHKPRHDIASSFC